jgi:lysophospholipase L1-like esterase
LGALTEDGNQNTSYTYYTSVFIKVESGKDYTLTLADTSLPGQHIYCLYDENKTFLSTVRNLNDSTTLNSETGLVISVSNSSAKYIRVSVKKESYKHIRMSEGDTIPDEYGMTATIDFGKPVYNEGVIPYGVFAGSSLLVQGDSLCGGDSFSYSYTPKTWVDYIVDWLKIGTLYNDSVSNTGLKMHSDASIGYVARQAKWFDTYGADIDRIIIFGNMNDMQDACGLPVGEKTDASGADTVYGLLRKLIEAIVEDYPTAKIGFITSPCRGKSYALGACYGHGYYEGYVTAQKYICEEFGIPFLDLYHECATLRPYNADNKAHYFPDDAGGVHFNHEGHQAVAKQVLKWFVEKMS